MEVKHFNIIVLLIIEHIRIQSATSIPINAICLRMPSGGVLASFITIESDLFWLLFMPGHSLKRKIYQEPKWAMKRNPRMCVCNSKHKTVLHLLHFLDFFPILFSEEVGKCMHTQHQKMSVAKKLSLYRKIHSTGTRWVFRDSIQCIRPGVSFFVALWYPCADCKIQWLVCAYMQPYLHLLGASEPVASLQQLKCCLRSWKEWDLNNFVYNHFVVHCVLNAKPCL